ncbi:MAG: hypothetical protein GY793_01305 [Proteobacteria bacterium]|nr:hypothetical protein [Pseudomonadota bacterium]
MKKVCFTIISLLIVTAYAKPAFADLISTPKMLKDVLKAQEEQRAEWLKKSDAERKDVRERKEAILQEYRSISKEPNAATIKWSFPDSIKQNKRNLSK